MTKLNPELVHVLDKIDSLNDAAFKQLERENEVMAAALRKIASCEERAPGDVVSIAREALANIAPEKAS